MNDIIMILICYETKRPINQSCTMALSNGSQNAYNSTILFHARTFIFNNILHNVMVYSWVHGFGEHHRHGITGKTTIQMNHKIDNNINIGLK